MLVNEREEWGTYLLRDVEPFDSWGYWPPALGLRGIPEDGYPPGLPHTPDFDDYDLDFVEYFPLLFERKSPGGSRRADELPPDLRDGALPRMAAPGPGPRASPPARLRFRRPHRCPRCRRPAVQRLLRVSERAGRALVAAVPLSRPLPVITADVWDGYEPAETPAPPGFVGKGGGRGLSPPCSTPAATTPGSRGASRGACACSSTGRGDGTVFGDLGLASGWHPLGRVDVRKRTAFVSLESLSKPWWQSGSKRPDLAGRLVFVPRGGPSRLITVQPERARTLCGRRLDWIEVPA